MYLHGWAAKIFITYRILNRRLGGSQGRFDVSEETRIFAPTESSAVTVTVRLSYVPLLHINGIYKNQGIHDLM